MFPVVLRDVSSGPRTPQHAPSRLLMTVRQAWRAFSAMSSQRKNLDALTQINQLAVEGMQTIARHQLKIMQRAIEHASALFRDWTHPVALDGRMAKMSRLRNRRSRRASSAPA